MPIQTIALALTVVRIQAILTTLNADGRTPRYQIECCINEWTDGTHKEFKWDEEGYKVIYHSHISSLNDLRDHSRRQGEDLVAQLQRDLLRNAR
jgi:Domain of unknown function (DUF6532)